MRGMREEQRRTVERLEGIDGRLEGIDGRLEGIDGRLEGIEATMLEAATQIRGLARATRVTLDAKQRHEDRFEELERRVTALERDRSFEPPRP